MAAGNRFRIIGSGTINDKDIIESYKKDLHQTYWARASQHWAGAGLEQGPPCFSAVHDARKFFLKNDRPALARMVYQIAAGGASLGERHSRNKSCFFCGALDTGQHRYYGCKKAVDSVKDDEFATKWLKKTWWLTKPRAMEDDMFMEGFHHQGPEIQDCMRCRGLIPRDLSFQLLGIGKARTNVLCAER